MAGVQWSIVAFTVKTALLSTLVILPPGIGLAWLLAKRQWPGKSVVETLVSLPLVMPPVATGLLLLMLLGRRGPLGAWLYERGIEVAFTATAVVVALGVMSFPLLVRASRVAFEEVSPRLEQIAATLGSGNLRIFFTVTLPLAARGVLAGTVLAFSRAL
ncbi:MAG: molybdenum ABC transporter permease subunit, partial [Verrucomicrobia bacterium RIFCSPLOWO2_12_FULL_64_8]